MNRYQFDPVTLAGFEASPVPFAIFQFIDKRVVTLALSAGFCEQFDFKDRAAAYAMMDNDMYSVAHPDDKARVADAAFRFATEGGEFNVLFRTKTHTSEDYFIIHAVGKHVYTDTGVRLAYVWYTSEGVYVDDPESGDGELSRFFGQALRRGSIIYQNHYDQITGLPNMTYFFELAEAGIQKMQLNGEAPAILFIDMCGMKGFNNRWGFAEGDKLIRDFGHLMAERFGNEGCSRIGQDHFAAFTTADGLEDRLNELFEANRGLNGGKNLPLRVGIYRQGSESVEIGKGCDRAKMACDVNRDAQVSSFAYFDEQMLRDAENRQYIIDNFDRALAEGWIKVYYQPIVRAANGRVCDEEALSRWIDPVRGYLSPAEFIPTLEAAKLVYKLDLYVVDHILEKMKRQAEANLFVVPQSVNISRVDFDCCDIVEEIRSRVDASGIDRSKLTIELTESMVGKDFDFIKAQVERFKSLGFPVWMDDFGSGYSSLDVLQNIKFDLIKFDMHFMRQFDSGVEARIILTELVRMAIGLGVETVCEGVEREDQVEFLREIGCTKIQGFYYCKAIPLEGIIERNRKGIQIGFENPEESEYYNTIGGINLYDLAVISSGEGESFRHYFDTVPVAIFEINGSKVRYTRCNKSYRDFMQRTFGVTDLNTELSYEGMEYRSGSSFFDALMRCSRDGNRALIDEMIDAKTTVHSFIRRVAVNPVTGATAIAVAILAIMEDKGNSGTTFAHIARALSSDYINLYYVDLDTDQFIEYNFDANRSDLAVERRGGDFFNASREDAKLFLYKDDRETFIATFTKENVMRMIDEHGTFTLTYRLLMNGQPTYVNMKAVRMQGDGAHIILGVSNVDAQVREKEAVARIRAEQANFARITALSGNYICIYSVDPETDSYLEFSATEDYADLGLAKQGEHFFDQARKQSERTVFPEDVDRFNAMFTKENVMREIERNGVFALSYRLVIDGEPVYVSVRAVLIDEAGSHQLIIGVSNIDAQVKRELEYERKLSAARNKANLDGLTGVKNRTAYENMSDALTRQIEEGQPVQYAIALCGVKSLDEINRTQGRPAGDQLIRKACAVICETFKHSPVFRVAGDEFAVIAQGHDYEVIDELLAELEHYNGTSESSGGPTIVWGMARYTGGESVASVFARAEKLSKRAGE